jgi:hypothetical protein
MGMNTERSHHERDMPLTGCPGCRELVSAQAPVCPNCGHHASAAGNSTSWKVVAVLGTLVGAALVLSLAFHR